MQTKDDLIRENAMLRARLELAEQWMQREVQKTIRDIQKQSVKSQARKHFTNLLEEEGTDIIARHIQEIFGESLNRAPEFTLERLIDAEIYWQILQKYPTMDGLPIVMTYQKILDAWIEKALIAPWRKHRVIQGSFTSDGLDRDIQNVITKKYTLSIGRLYQILGLVREKKIVSPMVIELVNFWKEKDSETLTVLVSDDFFLPFTELMDRELFTKKRHETKVTFGDVKKVREILIEKRTLVNIF